MKTMYATRDFKDAGTLRAFEGGKPVEADAATLANYKAAGLVSTDQPQAVSGDQEQDTPHAE
jgi:hypothetical protein